MRLRIGSRKSTLALIQAKWVGAELLKINPPLKISFKGISTQGDRDQKSSLQRIGGKGVFVKEIEEALLKGEIDLAVHSLKDVPQILPHGLTLGPFPKREDPREAFISASGKKLEELPRGSKIGTSSPRRAAQLKFKFGDKFIYSALRGNVESRIRKLEDGFYDGIIMAVAGLRRLGLASKITEIIETSVMMPAPCQGCLGLELRADDLRVRAVLEGIKDEGSDTLARAERAFLKRLGGDCLIPVGSSAKIEGEYLEMAAVILDNEGRKEVHAEFKGNKKTPEIVGQQLADALIRQGVK